MGVAGNQGSERWASCLVERGLQFVKNERAYALLILVVLLRLLLVMITIQFPEGAALVDSRAYMAFASTIIQGATYTDLNSPPGYPFFIALASGWSSPSFVWTVFAQLVLSSTCALMLVLVGKKVLNKRAGLLAGWFYALSPNTSLWALTIMSETLYTFLLVVSLWVWLLASEDLKLHRYFVLGILLGGGAMVRNIGLLVIPLWIGIHLIRTALCKHYVQAIMTSLAITLGSTIMLIPWGVHNQIVHGEFTITEEHGRTFYVFNVAAVLAEVEGLSRDQAAARMATAVDPFGLTLELFKEHPIIFLREQGKGVLRTFVGVSSGAWARAFGYPLELQGSFQLMGGIFSGDFAIALQRVNQLLEDHRSAILLGVSFLGILHSVLLYVLSLGNFFARRVNLWVYVLLLSTTALLILSPGSVGQARFRIPAEPYLTLLAGVGWVNYQFRASSTKGIRRQ